MYAFVFFRFGIDRHSLPFVFVKLMFDTCRACYKNTQYHSLYYCQYHLSGAAGVGWAWQDEG